MVAETTTTATTGGTVLCEVVESQALAVVRAARPGSEQAFTQYAGQNCGWTVTITRPQQDRDMTVQQAQLADSGSCRSCV